MTTVFAVWVELLERLVHRPWRVLLSVGLLWALTNVTVPHVHDGLAAGLPRLAVQFAFLFVGAIVVVHVYRQRGVAALWIALTIPELLDLIARSRSLGDPSFVMQSNLIIGVLVALLGIGVWGYVGKGISQRVDVLRLGDDGAG